MSGSTLQTLADFIANLALRDFGPWLIPPLALLAAALPSRTAIKSTEATAHPRPSPAASQQPASKPPREDLGSTDHDAFHLLCQFLNTDDPSACVTEGVSADKPLAQDAIAASRKDRSSKKKHRTAKRGAPGALKPPSPDPGSLVSAADTARLQLLKDDLRSEGHTLDFLIATMPDPIESHLQYDSDLMLDGIQPAVAAAGYSLDSFDLPWSTKSSADNQPGAPKRDPEREPGMLLYRKGNRLLLIFLIGETPTAGVHKLALSSALGQAAAIEQICALPGNREIRLLGPYFTGSAPSLNSTVKTFKDGYQSKYGRGFPGIRIIGQASGVDQWLFDDLKTEKGASHVFYATQHRSDALVEAVLGYLSTRLGANIAQDVAILEESGTDFGQSLGDQGTWPGLHLPFPLHISAIRSAAKVQAPTDQPLTLSLGSNNAVFSVLTPETIGEDLIPAYSGDLERAATDLMLSDLTATLTRERIRYVLILATNIQDTIFLAQQIRAMHSDITVLVAGTDLLYFNPDVYRDLQNIMVFTTYPLFTADQLWISPFEGAQRRLKFSSERALAVYNAALALLDDPEQDLALGERPTDLMLAYGPPFAYANPATPPIWLVAAGRNGFWPVALIDGYRSFTRSLDESYLWERETSDLGGLPADLSRNVYSPFGLFVFMLITLFSLYFAAVQVFPEKVLTGGCLREPVFKKNRPAGSLRLLAFWLNVSAVFLAALYLQLAPTLVAFHHPGEVSVQLPWLQLAAGAATAALLLIALVLIVWRALPAAAVSTASPAGSDWLAIALLIAAPALALYLLLRYLWSAAFGADEAGAIFASFRFSNLGSGLSTFAPILLLGMAGLLSIYCVLRRLRLLEAMAGDFKTEIPAPFLGFETGSFSDLVSYENEIYRSLSGTFVASWPAWFAVLIPSLILWGYAFLNLSGWGLFPSIEGPEFDQFSAFIFFAVYLGLSLSLVRFILVWWQFRRFLHRLWSHPLLEACVDWDKETARLPLVDLSVPTPTFTSLEFSVERAYEFASLSTELTATSDAAFRQWAAGLRTDTECLQQGMAKVMRSRAERDHQKALESSYATQTKLSQLAGCIATVLEPFWGPHNYPSSADGPLAGWLRTGERFLTSRVMDYCRHILAQLRNLLACTILGMLLTLMAVSYYPFQRQDRLLVFNWGIVLVAVVAAVSALVQMNRDRTLSLLSGGRPNEIDWNRAFFVHLLLYAVIPVLTLLGVQFPAPVDALLRWLGSAFAPAPHS